VSWGSFNLGVLALKETYTVADSVNETSGVRKITLAGRETNGWMTRTRLREIAEDMMTLRGRTFPGTFSNKTDRNGYYRVDDINTSVTDWDANGVALDWNMDLTFLGPDNAVDVESRMAHVIRGGLSGSERWHAPPIGHNSYYIGATSPTSLIRTGVDGGVTVYRSIPAVNPRYGVPLSSYLAGRARILAGGSERVGTGITMTSTGWEINNGLVRVRPATVGTTTLYVAVWGGTSWNEKVWDIRLGSDALIPGTHFLGATIIRNSPELVTIRLLVAQPTSGLRTILDLSLRRGSRFVEGYIQRTTSGDITVCLDNAEASTLTGKYSKANAPDGAGNTWGAGSSRVVTLASNGGITMTATTDLDFWIGAEVPGAELASSSNSGFELGTTFNWVAVNGAVAAVTTPSPADGSYSGRLTANGSGAAQLNFGGLGSAVSASTQYVLSGWLMSPVSLAASAAHIAAFYYNGVSYNGASAVLAPALTANIWTPVGGIVTTAAGTTTAGRQASLLGTPANGSLLYVDNLRLRALPDTGDSVATLQSQYLAVASETMVVVPR